MMPSASPEECIEESSTIVSVIITTKNEEINIERCIQSVLNQTFKSLELIVVDNYSDDKTVKIAQKYNTKVYLKGNERSAQRNYGAKVAMGKYVIYVDADMILGTHLIEECVKKCENSKVDALYVPERIVGDGFWIKVRDFERSFYTGTVIDAVRFVRRDMFLQVGGFDESLIGPEDWDFDRKIREIGRVDIASVSLFHNEGRFNIKRYLNKKRYYTNGIKSYAEKWGISDLETKKQIGMQYRLVGVFLEDDKWKRLLKNLPCTVGMYWLRINVAIAFFKSSKNIGFKV